MYNSITFQGNHRAKEEQVKFLKTLLSVTAEKLTPVEVMEVICDLIEELELKATSNTDLFAAKIHLVKAGDFIETYLKNKYQNKSN